MRDIIKWCLDNINIIEDVIKLLLTAGSFLYATIIHMKSKKRLTALEMEQEIKTDLVKTIEDLKAALERKESEQ